VAVGEEFIHESILGTTFSCRIEELATVGGIPAVTCSVAGQAYVRHLAGRHRVTVEGQFSADSGWFRYDLW
jgi:proline racemase